MQNYFIFMTLSCELWSLVLICTTVSRYYIKRSYESNKWIIYLEGSFCIVLQTKRFTKLTLFILDSSKSFLNCSSYRSRSTYACILKAHSKSRGSIWASLECQCCFWIAGGWVSYLTVWLLTLQLFKNSIDTQGKLKLNLHSLSVSELSEYRRLTW
jgi:hypothetical protein